MKISDILGANEPDFSHRLEYFERLSGQPAEDIRLIGDLVQKHKQIAEALNLDKHDTTARELYFVLNKRALDDSEVLAKKIRVLEGDSPEQVAAKCVKFAKFLVGKKQFWALRSAVAKRQLADNPPKKLMKIFHLRSVDSALKREPLANLYIFAFQVEPKSWHDKFVAQGAQIKNSDFGQQNVRISVLSKTRRQQLKKANIKPSQVVYALRETAEILVVPTEKRFSGDILFLLNTILTYINSLSVNSAFLKHRSLIPNFNQAVQTARKHGFENYIRSYSPVGWPALVLHMRRHGLTDELAMQLNTDDLNLITLAEILDGESVWDHNFFVHGDGRARVSSNLSDVLLNAINRLEPENAYVFHGQNELHDELFARYLLHDPVLQHVLDSLEQRT